MERMRSTRRFSIFCAVSRREREVEGEMRETIVEALSFIGKKVEVSLDFFFTALFFLLLLLHIITI